MQNSQKQGKKCNLLPWNPCRWSASDRNT